MRSDIFDKKNWKRGRHYRFIARPGEGCVLCQDINIAAALLCKAGEIEWDKDRKSFNLKRVFQPASFAGVEIGREKGSDKTLFFFKIAGSIQALNFRRHLFHAGLHWTDSAEFRSTRERLLDALREAKLRDRDKTYIPVMRGGVSRDVEDKSEKGGPGGEKGVRRAWQNLPSGGEGKSETGPEVGSEKNGEQASRSPGKGGRTEGGKE